MFIETYGCTYNKADSDGIREILSSEISSIAFCSSEKNADVVVINSCSVKDATASKILHRLSELRAGGTKTVVCGCLAQTSPALVKKAHPAAVLVGTKSLSRISNAVMAAFEGKIAEFLSDELRGKLPLPVFVDGVFARIPIAQGCLGACSFCSAKLARGTLESRAPKEILRACEQAVKAGAKELQLTGQDTGCYGFDLKPIANCESNATLARSSLLSAKRSNLRTIGSKHDCKPRKGIGKTIAVYNKTSLAELLAEVCKIEGDFRVRVGMMNPQHAKKILPFLLGAFAHEKIYKFLHVSVQSGSEKVLKAMQRQHSVSDFVEVVRAFREKFSEITIATDLIVGFPTETGEDFEKSLQLLRQTRPTVCNVSKYSPRPGTTAARLPLLDNLVVKHRSEVASALCKKISMENKKPFVGKKMRVLVVETGGKNGVGACAGNYLSVVLQGGAKARLGEFLDVEIVASGQSHLKGKLA